MGSPAIFATSIGMRRRWQAKIAFMIWICWVARSPETERMRIRECREGGVSWVLDWSGWEVVAVVVDGVRESLFM